MDEDAWICVGGDYMDFVAHYVSVFSSAIEEIEIKELQALRTIISSYQFYNNCV